MKFFTEKFYRDTYLQGNATILQLFKTKNLIIQT